MQSVLNEESFFDTMNNVLKAVNKFTNRSDTGKNKNGYYLGGSISRYAKNLTMSFPVLVDDSLSIETAQMISKANEKNIASMLEMLFASMSINGKDGMNGKDVIAKFHKNIDSMSVDDYIDAANDYVATHETAYIPKITSAQIRDIQREMCYQLSQPEKAFPTNSFNEKSLNDYLCKEEYDGIRVFEHHILNEADSDEMSRNKFGHQQWKDSADLRSQNQWSRDYQYRRDKDAAEFDYRQRKDAAANARDTRDFEYRQNRDATADARDAKNFNQRKDEFEWKKSIDAHNLRKDADSTVRNDLRDTNNLNQHRILDGDFKKANELQPTMMVVNFNIVGDTDNIIDRRSFVAGVKCRMIATSSIDIAERLLSTNKTQTSFKNLIRATTGEIKLGRDFILAVDQQKLDAMNDVKKGEAAKLWNALKKRSVKNTANKIKRDRNDATSITTLVVSQDTVNYMVSEANFNIEAPKNAKMIMDRYNLLCLVIADETNEVAKFLYDGNSEYESISYLVLGREAKDREMRKATELLMRGR